MKKLFLIFVVMFSACSYVAKTNKVQAHRFNDEFYRHKLTTLSGEDISLSEYKNKVILISNIALKCGTTPQLKALEEVYERYKEQGLVVLGFPSNDFTGVEPKDPMEYKYICTKNYGVSFPLFSMSFVRGDNAEDLFKFLSHAGPKEMKGEITFNFEKFLVDKTGNLRKRYGSFTGALSSRVTKDIENLLKE